MDATVIRAIFGMRIDGLCGRAGEVHPEKTQNWQTRCSRVNHVNLVRTSDDFVCHRGDDLGKTGTAALSIAAALNHTGGMKASQGPALKGVSTLPKDRSQWGLVFVHCGMR